MTQIESSKSLANRKGQLSLMPREKAGKSHRLADELLCGPCGFLVPLGDSVGEDKDDTAVIGVMKKRPNELRILICSNQIKQVFQGSFMVRRH